MLAIAHADHLWYRKHSNNCQGVRVVRSGFFCLSRKVGFFWCFFPEEETLDYLGRGPIVVVTVVHSSTPTVSVLGNSGSSSSTSIRMKWRQDSGV